MTPNITIPNNVFNSLVWSFVILNIISCVSVFPAVSDTVHVIFSVPILVKSLSFKSHVSLSNIFPSSLSYTIISSL